MHPENIEAYIQQKLRELDKKKDMQDVLYKGKLSFGIDSTTYGHLPGWQQLAKQKKRLVKLFWLNAILLSLMATVMAGHFFEGTIADWWKDAIRLLIKTGFILIIPVAGMYFNLFATFRQTEREVRKLIYQDMLAQLEREKEAVA